MFSSSNPSIFLLSILLLLFPLILAHGDEHISNEGLPSKTWYHERDSSIHKLFRRDSQTFADVGSPTWLQAYPSSTPDTTKTPKEWTDALAAAVAAGKIPNIPVPTSTGSTPVYPAGVNSAGSDVCSASDKCTAPGDIWNAPDGSIGIAFDDGPVAGNSSILYNFLKSTNQKATHFMIGVAIYQAPTTFLEAFNNGGDIAVHTYTHPYMSSLSNADVLAQLGWSMQIIHDSTQGKVPKFWRPPYGNMDNRVRAIAREVFGLTPIMWNRDPFDWSVWSHTGTTTTPPLIASNLSSWITGPKSPGLLFLEHELYNETVQAYINAYPTMLANKWKTVSVAQLVPSSVDNVVGQTYWNGPPGTGKVTSSEGILGAGNFANASAVANTTSSTTSSSSSTSSGTSTSSSSSSLNTQANGKKSSAFLTTPISFFSSVLVLVSWTLYGQ